MKALVIKDLQVLRSTLKYYLLLIAVFTVALGEFGSVFVLLYAAMLPYTALAYDERAHFELQAATMPYSWRDLVLSKYLLGWLVMLAALPVSVVIALVAEQFGIGHFYFEQQLSGLFCGMMLIAFCLPLMFRKGVEVGRLLNILLILVCSALSMSIFTVLAGLVKSELLLWLLLAVFVVGVSVVSLQLSEKWYRKRIMN